MPNWKKVIVSGSDATLNSLFVANAVTASVFSGSHTGSLFGTASWASNAVSTSFSSTASFVNTLNQNVLIINSLTVGTSSLGSNENTLILGPSPAGGVGEGGQLLLAASGGLYTSASMLDTYQNKFRVLRGTNAGSDGLVTQFDLQTKQMQLPAYTGASSFSGTATANLAVDSGGNVITVSTSGGSVFPYTGVAAINGGLIVTGSITASSAIHAQANGTMYFRGGDDAELWDINVANTVGVYGQQDQAVASIKLGSGGGTISGRSGSIGIGTITPNSASLTVNGNVWATSFTGSLLGTASFAASASQALTASYILQAISASFATLAQTANTASYVLNAVSASFAATAALAPNYVLNSATSSFVVNSQTSSFVLNSQTASMLAPYVPNSQTSSFVTNSQTGSFATTDSNTFRGNQVITGSIILSSSAAVELTVIGNQVNTGSLTATQGFTGSLLGTASWATNAITASYVLGGSSTITIQDEGASQGSAGTINFTGAGVTATVAAGTATVNISGGGGASFPYTGSAVITGSLIVTGSTTSTLGFTGSLFGTSSFTLDIDGGTY